MVNFILTSISKKHLGELTVCKLIDVSVPALISIPPSFINGKLFDVWIATRIPLL